MTNALSPTRTETHDKLITIGTDKGLLNLGYTYFGKGGVSIKAWFKNTKNEVAKNIIVTIGMNTDLEHMLSFQNIAANKTTTKQEFWHCNFEPVIQEVTVKIDGVKTIRTLVAPTVSQAQEKTNKEEANRYSTIRAFESDAATIFIGSRKTGTTTTASVWLENTSYNPIYAATVRFFDQNDQEYACSFDPIAAGKATKEQSFMIFSPTLTVQNVLLTANGTVMQTRPTNKEAGNILKYNM